MLVALVASFSVMAAECMIIPRPVSYEAQEGVFSLSKKTAVYVADKSLAHPATLFCSYVEAEMGLHLAVVEKMPKSAAIALSIDKTLAEEAYTLILAALARLSAK